MTNLFFFYDMSLMHPSSTPCPSTALLGPCIYSIMLTGPTLASCGCLPRVSPEEVSLFLSLFIFLLFLVRGGLSGLPIGKGKTRGGSERSSLSGRAEQAPSACLWTCLSR